MIRRACVQGAFGLIAAAALTFAAHAQPAAEEPASQPAAAPRHAIDGRILDNLEAFARLYGHLRFFNPSEESFSTDFEALAVRGARITAGARTTEELAERLDAVFRPLAPTLRVGPSGSGVAPGPVRAAPGAPIRAIIAVAHEGFAFPGDTGVFESVRRQIALDDAKMQSVMASPASPVVVDLGGGVEAAYFAALWVDSENLTIPRGAPADESALAAWEEASPLDEATARRLGAIIITWNAVWHFAPYLKGREQDWLGALPTALLDGWEAPPPGEPLAALRAMLAKLQDSQADVYPHGSLPLAPQLMLETVEGRVVVTAAPSDAGQADGLAPGDVVVSIGEEEVESAVSRAERYVSAARAPTRRALAIEHLLSGGRGTWFEFEAVGRDGTVKSHRLERLVPIGTFHPHKPSRFERIAPGVVYIDPSEFHSPAEMANEIRAADALTAVIVDLRGDTANSIGPALGFWLGVPEEAPPRAIPTPPLPDRERWLQMPVGEVIQPKPPRQFSTLVLLTDETTAGDSEMDALAAKHLGIGAIVGRRTGGTAGTTAALPLAMAEPKCLVMWTQMKVTGYDGAMLYGEGVEPDVVVEPTIDGLRAGRDETLDAALAIVRASALNDPR